jgi:hypothetical protein
MTRVKVVVAGLTSAALVLSGCALLVFGLISAYRGNSPLLAVCIAGAILLIFAANIDRFESLKGLGMEAKTKQLDRKLVEADQAIDQLRQLAETLGKESVAANSKLGRLDSAPTAEESYLHAQAIRSVLTNLGSKPETIREMLRPFVHMMLFDMTTALLHPVKRNLRGNINKAQKRRRLTTEDPLEGAESLAALEGAHKFERRMVSHLYSSLAIEDYPGEVLKELNAAPLVDHFVKEAAQKELISFSSEMFLLRTEGRLEKPSEWFAKVGAYLARDPNDP